MTRLYLSRKQMLGADDIVTEDVYVDVWKGWVCVKTLTGAERDKFESDIAEIKGRGKDAKIVSKANIRAKLVALSVVDPNTKEPVFSMADVEELGRKSAAALDAIFEVAQKLSKVSDNDVDELVKNSEETQGDDSTSD